jgi:malonate-semialdehyde dehydrogenase (acetylating)/methylmalonate-semialdehyde dehydrogenase
MPTIQNAIGGKLVTSVSTRTQPVFNPATGEAIATLPLSTNDEINAAVAAAKKAQPAWGNTTPMKRARVMFKFKELLEKHSDELARLISLEHGKVHDDALGELARGIDCVDFACGIPQLLKGEFSRNVGPSIDSYSDRQPLGVVAGITPFNFPAMVPMWMYPRPSPAGNAFILKPSERDPSAPMFCLAEAADGRRPARRHLQRRAWRQGSGRRAARPPRYQAVSFVGSTAIAEYVYRRGTQAGKRVQALGGAKNHMIIMPDADMDQAADALMGAAYGAAGERCMAISVAVPVGDKTADALVAKLKPRVEALKIGPGTDPKRRWGRWFPRQQRDKVVGLYRCQASRPGAKLVVDGRGFKLQGYENGFFVGGSLFDHVTPDMKIYKEEIFGPVLSVVRADTFDTRTPST